tara:strand:- start:410 stop:598 length:189 start_codon:yes stop_codon:yes gene_type:complete
MVMETRELSFTFNKETKNTLRFSEVVTDDATPVIGELYIRKSAVNGDTPKMLTLTVGELTAV